MASSLPATATAAATRTSASKTTPASSAATREEHPEQNAAQRRCQNDDDNNDQQHDSTEGNPLALLFRRGRRDVGGGELNFRIVGDDLRNARGDQQQRLTVLLAAHQRDGFPLKGSHFPIGQDRFEPIANFNAGPMVVDGIENQ